MFQIWRRFKQPNQTVSYSSSSPSIEDEEVEKAGEFTKEYHFHQDFNAGQLFWKPSEDMKRVLLKAFRAGNKSGKIDVLDQFYFSGTLRDEDDGVAKGTPFIVQV